MRVGIFTDSFSPYISGVVRSIHSLRQALQAQGHQVYVFAPAYPDMPARDDEPGVFRYPSFPAPNYPQFRIPLPAWRRVRVDASGLGLDLVHAHSPFVMGRLGWRAARQLGIPFCLTFHTLYDAYLERYATGMSPFLRPALNAYLQRVCNRADLVVSPTYAIYRYLRRLGVRSAIEVIPTGVDVARMAGGDGRGVRRLLGVPEEAPLLVYLGRLSQEKNLPTLVDALRRVALHRPDVHMVLVGDGPLRPALQETASQPPLRGRLHLPGAVEAGRVGDFLAAGDMYVFASVTETQGIALVEAMAAGLPVVCVWTDVTAEVVRAGTDGVLTDNDPGALARACLDLLADPLRRAAMSDAARQRASAFSLDRMVGRVIDVYTRLAHASPAHRAS